MKKAAMFILAISSATVISAITQAKPYGEYLKEGNKNSAGHAQVFSAEIMEIKEGGGYTFLKLRGSEVEWAAIRQQRLKVGDKVAYTEPLVMEDFYSKSLNQSFKKILFISKLRKVRVKVQKM